MFTAVEATKPKVEQLTKYKTYEVINKTKVFWGRNFSGQNMFGFLKKKGKCPWHKLQFGAQSDINNTIN